MYLLDEIERDAAAVFIGIVLGVAAVAVVGLWLLLQ